MKQKDLTLKLTEFLNLPAETEIFEFKQANENSFSTHDLGKYFSALSNEANLKNVEFAWLIFGVEDKSRNIVGTNYRSNRKRLDSLKKEIADNITDRISFIDIHELILPEGRVIMFQIPAAPCGTPLAWKGHYYGRDGESLVALNPEKRKRIEAQIEKDWSAEVCPDAKIDDLDSLAILKAKENYKNKYPHLTTEIEKWDDITFLNKAKIIRNGKITRTAIILLGKSESEHFLTPTEVKIRWILKDSKGVETDWQVEACPFLLAVDKIYTKIRNLKYRYIKFETLFPEEVEQYEPFVIYEALNNCIAHQDYTLGGRINVVESENKLIFTNLGSFIPGSVEEVIKADTPSDTYRNKFLVTAMVNLKMVDTIGSGIRRMFLYQSGRFFPLPEYDLSKNKVELTIIGKVLDIEYASVLSRDPELTLEEIMMLDKVQKRKKLTDVEFKHLKKKELIEGIRPNVFISAKVAQKTGQKAEYTKFKAFDKSYYLDLILTAINQHNRLTRSDIDELLWNKLPDWMTDKQKRVKIGNLLSELRINHKIKNEGSDFKPIWVLVR